MPEISLYNPNHLQRRLHDLAKRSRFSVFVNPRQHGKSTFGRVEAVFHAVSRAATVAIICPFRLQAKNIHWDALKTLALQIPGTQPNETELKLTFPDGGSVQLLGSDNADALRGLSLDLVIFDEARDIAEHVWPMIVRPALTARRGKAIFVSTPHGRNWFYELFQQAETLPGWGRVHVKASDIAVLPPGELASARREMSLEEYEQEFECSWHAVQVGAIFGTYLRELEQSDHIGDFPWRSDRPVTVALDLGIAESTAMVFVQEVQGTLRIIDYEEVSGLGLPDIIRILRNKPYTYHQYIAPHDVKVTELGSGKTRYEIARELGIHFDVAPKLSLADGLDAVKRLFPQLRIHRPSCGHLLEALAGYHRVWRPDLKMFSEKPEHSWHSHGCDALRYFAVGYREAVDISTIETQAECEWHPFRCLDRRYQNPHEWSPFGPRG